MRTVIISTLVLLVITTSSVVVAQEASPQDPWGFDGSEPPMGGHGWSLQVSSSVSSECSQSWDLTSLEGEWNLTVDGKAAVLSLELSGQSTGGSWQGGSSTTYAIEPRTWRWEGTASQTEDGVQLLLSSGADGQCQDPQTDGCQNLTIVCEEPREVRLPEQVGQETRIASRVIASCDLETDGTLHTYVRASLSDGRLVLARDGGVVLKVYSEMIGGSSQLLALIPTP